MSELYWITVLGNLSFVVGLFALILTFALLVICIGYAVMTGNDEYNIIGRKKLNHIIKILIIPYIICLLLSIFIPSKKELLVIYGIGGTIDYIQQNQEVNQLPDKYIKVLNKWADKELKDSIN